MRIVKACRFATLYDLGAAGLGGYRPRGRLGFAVRGDDRRKRTGIVNTQDILPLIESGSVRIGGVGSCEFYSLPCGMTTVPPLVYEILSGRSEEHTSELQSR